MPRHTRPILPLLKAEPLLAAVRRDGRRWPKRTRWPETGPIQAAISQPGCKNCSAWGPVALQLNALNATIGDERLPSFRF